jgi:hypothetical protein
MTSATLSLKMGEAQTHILSSNTQIINSKPIMQVYKKHLIYKQISLLHPFFHKMRWKEKLKLLKVNFKEFIQVMVQECGNY